MAKSWLFTLTLVSVALFGNATAEKDSVQVSTPKVHIECSFAFCGHDEYCCGEQKCCKYQCTGLGRCLDEVEFCCGHNECCPHECDNVECRENQFCCGQDRCCNFDEIYHQWWFWLSIVFILTLVVGSMIIFAYCERTRKTPRVFHLKNISRAPSKGYAKLDEEM